MQMIQNNRSRLILLIVIILTIVNLAAAITVVISIRKSRAVGIDHPSSLERNGDSVANGRGPAFLIEELGFNGQQQKAFRESRIKFRDNARPLFMEIRQLNGTIMEETLKDNPDTLKLDALSLEIGDLQAAAKQLTIRHLLEIKSIATPEQQEKLEAFYRELLSRDSGPMGKGMQHQHRRGQRRSGNE
jgi:hypothetical protein